MRITTRIPVRIPARFAPLLFAGMLSAIMVSIVSAVILLANQGATPDFPLRWFKSFATAWPVAFSTALVVGPFVRRIVARLTAE